MDGRSGFYRFIERIFRICHFEESCNVGYARRVIEHALAGAALGFLLLHPLSMVAHSLYHPVNNGFWDAIPKSFSFEHITMIVYFTVVGAVLGGIHGSYVHIISSLHEKIRIQAITDELTGLYNRRFFMSRLEQQLSRAREYNQPLSLLMIDIDFFKRFNDAYGHPAGDELLQHIGKLFQGVTRESDFAARYGGEEFVLMMPEVSGEEVLRIARQISVAISESPFQHQDPQHPKEITISAGVAEYPSDAQSMEELIRKADQALYTAKEEGRNRVCRADG